MLTKNTYKVIKLKSYNAGITYAKQEKKRLIAELDRLRANNGATLIQLKEYLDKMGIGRTS